MPHGKAQLKNTAVRLYAVVVVNQHPLPINARALTRLDGVLHKLTHELVGRAIAT